MALPSYVTTRAVTLGGAVGLESGEPLTISATVSSTKGLIWNATGYRFEQTGVAAQAAAGNQVTFTLPVTDQPGWRDPVTNSLIDVSADGAYTHMYVLRAQVGASPEIIVGPFALPFEDGSVVDLDVMLPASSSAGAYVTVPDSWSAQVTAARQAAVDARQAAAEAKASMGRPLDALIASLDMRDPRGLVIGHVGDATADGPDEWFETALRELFASQWPDRPARVKRWAIGPSSYPASFSTWQTAETTNGGTTTPSPLGYVNVYNGAIAGATIATQRSLLPGIIPQRPDLMVITDGHNYGAGAPSTLLNAIDAFLTDLFALYDSDIPIAVMSENPRFTADANELAHRTRQIALRAQARARGWLYLPGFEALSALPDGGRSYVNPDGVHPNPIGSTYSASRLQADAAKRVLLALSKRPTTSTSTPPPTETTPPPATSAGGFDSGYDTGF